MGFNNQEAYITGRPWIFVDLETAPLTDAADYIDPPDLSEIKAPKNYKDEAKIAAYIEQAKADALAEHAAKVEKAACDPELCTIGAIGFQTEAMSEPAAMLLPHYREGEGQMVREFWKAAQGRLIVGFCSFDFDLPVLLRRSSYLGVLAPQILRKRYDTDGLCDLAELLTFGGRLKTKKLSFYLKRYGIPHDSTVTGADMPKAIAAGDWPAVERHVLDDVRGGVSLAQRLGLIYQPEPVDAVI